MKRSDWTDDEVAELKRRGFDYFPLELGFPPAEIRDRVHAAILDGHALGHEGRALFVYLALVCPLLDRSREKAIWNRELRGVLGRRRRFQESFRERQTQLAFSL